MPKDFPQAPLHACARGFCGKVEDAMDTVYKGELHVYEETPGYGFLKNVRAVTGHANEHPDVFVSASEMRETILGIRDVLRTHSGTTFTFKVRASTQPQHQGKLEAYCLHKIDVFALV